MPRRLASPCRYALNHNVAKTMPPFFDGLIPEGWLLDIAQKTWKLDPFPTLKKGLLSRKKQEELEALMLQLIL